MANLDFGNFKGRSVVRTNAEEITTANIIDVIEEIADVYENNLEQSQFLDDYYRGQQEILSRVKTIRPDVNSKLVENRAYEIINFKTGYQYGKGAYYVSRYNEDTNREKIEKVNMYNGLINKRQADIEHLIDTMITGRGFRFARVSEDEFLPYEIFRMDAKHGDMVYTNEVIPRELCYLYYREAGQDDEDDIYVAYTDKEVITVIGDDVSSEPHSLEAIPVVETVLNERRMGAFEPILGLLEAVNLLQSDRINSVEQFVQSLVVMTDVEFEDGFDMTQINSIGGIELKTPDNKPNAGIKFLNQEINQTGVQTLKNDILMAIQEISALPGRNQSGGSGGDTGVAVELRDGWANAETFARTVDPYIMSSEMKLAKVIAKCYNLSETGELLPNEIEVKYNRNPRVDMVSTTTAMLNQQSFGIDPAVIIANSELYSDPDEVYNKSKTTLDNKLASERTVNTESERTDNQTQEEVV